jgi:hypothetical protein
MVRNFGRQFVDPKIVLEWKRVGFTTKKMRSIQYAERRKSGEEGGLDSNIDHEIFKLYTMKTLRPILRNIRKYRAVQSSNRRGETISHERNPFALEAKV